MPQISLKPSRSGAGLLQMPGLAQLKEYLSVPLIFSVFTPFGLNPKGLIKSQKQTSLLWLAKIGIFWLFSVYKC
jgi:hypothetical protein